MKHSVFQGAHYDAGFHWGTALRQRGEHPLTGIPLGEERRAFAAQCLPLYEAHYPELLCELRGMADGLNTPFEDLAAFLCSMYCLSFENFCSCIAVSDGTNVLLGRNSDFFPRIAPLCDSALYTLENGYSFVGNTTSWSQMEDGMNEHGLAVGLTFVYPTKLAPGFNAGVLVRYLLERCRTVEEALEALRQLPIGSAQTLTMADKTGRIAVVECNCARIEVRGQGEKAVFATNHFMSPAMQAYQTSAPDDIHSHERYETMRAACGGRDEFSAAFVKELLSGKHGFLCQYGEEEPLKTLWACVFAPREGAMFRVEGTPSREAFQRDERLVLR